MWPLSLDWEPDPDVGGLMQILGDVPGVWAGFTRYDTARFREFWVLSGPSTESDD